MEMVSSIVKDQPNRFIIEMGDFAVKKKTIIISGIAAVLVIGSVVFCFAVKGDSTQPAEVAQEVVEAVETPTIEIPEEVVEEPEVEDPPEEVVEEPEVEETPEEVVEEPEVAEVPEEPVETPEVEETSIVEVAETSEDAQGVSTQTEEVSQPVEPKQEEVKPAETKPAETQPQQPVQTQPQQTTVDAQRDAIVAELNAMGANWGISEGNFELGDRVSNVGLQWE